LPAGDVHSHMRQRRPEVLQLTRTSLLEFLRNDPLRLAGATAFFTTFALPAILLIILQIARFVLTENDGKKELFVKLDSYVGNQSAKHLINVLRSFETVADNWATTIAGFIFLLFVATTLFKVIKNSLNQIWDIKVVAKRSFALTLNMRLRELAVILSAGILFLVSLLIDGMQAMASEEFLKNSRVASVVLNSSIAFIVSVIVASVWFGLIFSFLPDGRFSVATGFIGAIVTSVLFNIGKLILRSALHNSILDTIFGNSAAVILLLLFVFYSSLIFYLGAAFTKVLAAHKGIPIKPLRHAEVQSV
jgi:membrane protein